MEVKRLFTLALVALAFACTPDKPKEIPEWGKHGGETPVGPVEPIDTTWYSAGLIIESASADECGIAVKYSFADSISLDGCKYGLAVSAPSLTNPQTVFQGPASTGPGEPILQVIPTVGLENGSGKVYLYHISAEGVRFSEPAQFTIPDQPSELVLTWEKLSFGELPAGIEIYHTTTPVDGKNFEAWYALADLSAVDMKIKVPSSTATLENQAAGDAATLVLVNGGYFYNGKHTGHAVVSGSQVSPVPAVRGSLRSNHPEYNVMYNVTRGTLLLGSDGKPSIAWAGTDGSSVTHYYSRPLASVAGEARYGLVTPNLPVQELGVKPAYALGAGPVLLYGGEIPFNFAETGRGTEYYLNNFEIMPYDIFGPDSVADRTCVGLKSDGKAVLFICDGRIKSSSGLDLVQLARIMKGLGCVDAVNMDGGGSTAMWVKGSGRLNSLEKNMNGDLENRPVVSTIGLYAK